MKSFFEFRELVIRRVSSVLAAFRGGSEGTHHGKNTARQDSVHVGTNDYGSRSSRCSIRELLLSASSPNDNDSEKGFEF